MARWLFWTLATILTWGIWAILYRLIAGDLSEAHSQAISTLGIVPILAALALADDSRAAENRARGIWLAFGSGVLSCLGNIACYQALSHAKAATVVPLTALYPLVTITLAIPILKERFNLIQMAGIGLSLVAILMFNVQQGTEDAHALVSPWLLMALAAVVLWGATGLMQKMSTNHISARSSAVWFLAAFLPVAGVILLFDPLPSGISTRTWSLAAALGFTLALGNLTILLAYSSGGKASIITPLAGLYPLVSIPIAIVALGEELGGREVVAIVLALTAVVMLSYQSQAESASGRTPTPKMDTLS